MAIAIIAEYNPFHFGHKYQLDYVKKHFPNDEIIVILSGNYVQRGEIAIKSFEERKNIALKFGANKVIELPFEYATQAAHIFAQGAIKIIYQNKIDKLIFGSESNDVDSLFEIANIIKHQNQEYKKKLKFYLKQGFSFPKSNYEALKELTNKEIILPNDILALEYVKQIVENNYPIKVYSHKRTIEYNSDEINGIYTSASNIRKMVWNNQDVSKFGPMDFTTISNKIESYYKDFQTIIRNTSKEKLASNKMISEGMENLFIKNIDSKTYEEFVDKCTSKRYTSSRIKRVILYLLLNKGYPKN
ncbi:nucleotidyltransferase [[Mycoplasma] collis]|uniref:nucleotidyltransferase n=1 Tax=[Mycoplasma] collis TaxID=2127 RepID=UPI00051C1757|nr:nucleotidyltransferase [[Mycoplasma] collis]